MGTQTKTIRNTVIRYRHYLILHCDLCGTVWGKCHKDFYKFEKKRFPHNDYFRPEKCQCGNVWAFLPSRHKSYSVGAIKWLLSNSRVVNAYTGEIVRGGID